MLIYDCYLFVFGLRQSKFMEMRLTRETKPNMFYINLGENPGLKVLLPFLRQWTGKLGMFLYHSNHLS